MFVFLESAFWNMPPLEFINHPPFASLTRGAEIAEEYILPEGLWFLCVLSVSNERSEWVVNIR